MLCFYLNEQRVDVPISSSHDARIKAEVGPVQWKCRARRHPTSPTSYSESKVELQSRLSRPTGSTCITGPGRRTVAL